MPRASPQRRLAHCCPGHHRARTGDVTSVAAALLELPALPALRLAAAVVISIAMAMPAPLPRRVRLCLRQADAVPRRAGAPLPPLPTQPNGHSTGRGLTQPQNSVGMEMDTSPHPRGEVWVGSRGRRRGLHLEYLPCLPRSGYNQVPSTTAGPLCPTATPGSATAPLCWYQPTVPKAISTSIRLH